MRSFHFVILLFLLSCNSVNSSVIKDNCLHNYDFNNPETTIELPKELKEISGICFINDTLLAAVSDNRPYIYVLNLEDNKINSQIYVAAKGDFEDVTICRDVAFVLQSNGRLWRVTQYKTDNRVIKSINLPLQSPFELEGLSHNISFDTIFIAAKYWHNEYNLPVWSFAIKENNFLQNSVLNISAKKDFKKNKHPFHTSGILRINNDRWVCISTNDKYIAELNNNGTIENIIALNDKIFQQPEGIAIARDSSIYISNEGRNGKATLLKFKKKKE